MFVYYGYNARPVRSVDLISVALDQFDEQLPNNEARTLHSKRDIVHGIKDRDEEPKRQYEGLKVSQVLL
jgi:hypothetical protein